jgi:hypothetical protein
MRACDNRFWWAEIESLPPNSEVTGWTSPHETKPFVTGSGLTASGSSILPSLPIPSGTRPLLLRGNVPTNNTLVLTAGNSRTTIWLSPEMMIDFSARINITVGGRRPSGVPGMIKPSVETMLEDLRVRGDRQHPFWAKVETK